MFSGNLLTINGAVIGHITRSSYDTGYHKLWGSKSGRGMDGRNNGTLVGIFTKLTIEVKAKTLYEVSQILKLINISSADVTYFDAETMELQTENFYFGDINIKLMTKKLMNYESFTFSIIGNNPREDSII